MVITTKNIVHYLLDQRLISAESVVDGDFMCIEATRRNRNFKILRKNGRSLFIKQVKSYDQQSLTSLLREAQSYHLASKNPAFTELAKLMPKMISYDAGRNILVLELLQEAENLSEMHQRLGSFPDSIATSLGRSLGCYHQDVRLMINEVNSKKVFPGVLPWMLTLNEQYINQAKLADPRFKQFFSIIADYPEFLHSIELLRNSWQINSLIHGDMKWDNCMVCQHEGGNDLTLKIIDWELADLGDSGWDVGAVFQTFLSLWVLWIPEGRQQASRFEIEALQPAIRSFWNAYLNTMTIDEAGQKDLLERCIRYAAIRMIQTVYEQVYFTTQLSKNAIYLLQLSLNTLKKPGEAINVLLGL
jgi:hypothetical protein